SNAGEGSSTCSSNTRKSSMLFYFFYFKNNSLKLYTANINKTVNPAKPDMRIKVGLTYRPIMLALQDMAYIATPIKGTRKMVMRGANTIISNGGFSYPIATTLPAAITKAIALFTTFESKALP